MQPVVGMISDRSKSKYGRRRPFMVAGTVAVFVCLLVLGWTKELVGWFVEDRELVCVCSIEFCEIRSRLADTGVVEAGVRYRGGCR